MVAEDIQMRIIGYMAAEHIIIPKVVCVDVLANYDRDTLTQYFKPVSLAADVVFRNFY